MPRKPIQDLIEELKSWLPNYDHGPNDYPTLLFRILASAPGGEELEDIGYEPFQLGWQEIDQLGRTLEAIQDKGDVEDLVAALLHEDGEETDETREARRRGGSWYVHWNNGSHNGPFDTKAEAKHFASYWHGQASTGQRLTYTIDHTYGRDERLGPPRHRAHPHPREMREVLPYPSELPPLYRPDEARRRPPPPRRPSTRRSGR